MRRKPSPTADHEADLARFAWWISFFVTLTLVVALGLAHSAQARSVPAAAAILPAAAAVLPAVDDEDFEDEAESSEDEGFEGYECDQEIEECEEEESGDGPGDGPEAPAECVLTSARAAVFAAANHDRVRLQIRYTTTAPTAVTVDYGLHGSKGTLFLGSERKRFGKKGVPAPDQEPDRAPDGKGDGRKRLHGPPARTGGTALLRLAPRPPARSPGHPEWVGLGAIRITQGASVPPTQAVASARCDGSTWWPRSDSR